MEKSIFEYNGINDLYGDHLSLICPKFIEVKFSEGKVYRWIPSGEQLDEILELRERNIKKSILNFEKKKELELYKSLILLL